MTSHAPAPNVSPPSTLHRLLERVAERDPAAIALVDAEGQVTHGELHRAANRLAHYLRARGVGLETPVAVLLPRTRQLPIALLGALKAGGATLALELTLPPARVRYMLADARVPLLLTDEATWAALGEGVTAEGWAGTVVLLDREADAVAAHPDTPPDEVATPDSLAQLIYTSGSTGAPKAGMIPHRAIPGFADAYLELAAPGREGEPEVWLQASSVSWDALTLELWMPLLRGAATVLYPPGPGGVSAAGVARLVERHGIDVLFLPPTFFTALLDAVPEALARARLILVGGDVFPPAAARAAMERLPRTRIVNLYGPSECTVAATAYALPAVPDALPPGPVPLGLPTGDRRVHLLDGEGREVAGEGAGELCIGGPAVARGYFGRPALTADRFVPDPFSLVPGARMYRTGDVARRAADGMLYFGGRVDRQAKVRGFRVEVGEVEAVLAAHPAVREAAVVARGSGAACRLAAYVVLRDPSVDARALAGWLRERVPAYEVPSTFTRMDALPLGANRKVDLAALPEPAAPPVSDEGGEWTAEEAAVARIWAEVLGVDRVGADDEFFALGGHSLAAAQVAARMRQELGAPLGAADVFAHPTVGEQARRIAADAVSPGRSIPRTDRGGDLPLAPGQEAVWFFQQLRPGMRSYTFGATVRIDGEVDAGVMERALTEIVRRHEAYRTTFHEGEGGPVQRVHPAAPVTLRHVDLSGVPEDEVRDRVREAFVEPFDVENGPVVRWTLFARSPEEHLLGVHEHHLVHDGWSFALFLRELTALYGAFSRGEPSPLPEPSLQFGDYAVWQREWLRGPEARAQLDWWRRTLEGVPPSLELPADRPRPEQMSFRGGAHRVRLPRALYADAEAFGRARGATPFMTLFAAFQALLHRYTGEADFCVGTAVAARHAPEVRDLVGMVVNTVPLRADLSGDPAFEELLARVRGRAVEAYAREQVPFAEIVAAAAPERSAAQLPLYSTVFSFHHAPYPELALPGATLRVEEGLETGWAKVELNVIVIPRAQQGAGDEVVMIWEFAEDLFDASTVRRMIGHYEALLAAALADPECPVSRLPLVPAEEERALLRLAGRPTPYPRDATVHGLFARAAAATPEVVAVRDGGGEMTYAELDRASSRLAGRLGARGAGPEARVAVAMERSAAMVASFLAAMRAGAAYVPLDPEHPAERLEYVLEQSGAAVLVVRGDTPPSLAGWKGPVVRYDELRGGEEDAPVADDVPVAAESLACVLYTSGSTGRPKGVAIVHRAIVRVVKDADYLQLGPADVVAQVTTPSFDVSLWEIWGALLNGSRLVVVGREEILSPPAFAARLRDEGVSALFLTPTGLRQVVAEVPDAFAGVANLLLGGEALEAPVLRQVLESGAPGRLLNAYGPTESTTYASWHLVDRVEPGASTVPIGRPVSNTWTYVLDRAMRPLPLGVPGELYLGGDGLARGYLGRPALTAERFLPDPFSGVPGARLYRTGDRVRWKECESAKVRECESAAGADSRTLGPSHSRTAVLEYFGRLDQQVKVRGHRVEPGEIEAVLRAHPAVRDAAVVPRDDGGERWLAAYAVAGDEGAADATALREWCAERLPAWMVPGAFTVLGALPLTASGKLDRRALPDPGGPAPAAEWEAPATATEHEIAAVWREVLGVERVGATDDLFHLGGHSLKATRILTRVGVRFGVTLPVSTIFDHPTVRGLAAMVDEQVARLRGDDEALLSWLESLSEEEAERMLAEKGRVQVTGDRG